MSYFISRIRNFLFKNQTLRQTVAKNTFWLGVGQIGGRLLRTAIIIYAARILGAEGWGVFSYAINLVALLTMFIDLGINPILTREVIKQSDPSERSKILSTAFFIKIVLITMGVIITVFAAPLFTKIETAKPLLPIIAAILVFESLREFAFSLTRALEKMEIEASLFIITNIAVVGLGFIFLALTPTVKSLTYSYAVGTGLGALATFYVLRQHFKNVWTNFASSKIKPILTAALPFAISVVLGGLTINTDIFLIGLFRSAEEVGYYSAAQRIIQLLYLLPSLLGVSIFPVFSRLAQTDKEKMRLAVEKSLSFTLLAALPIAIGGAIVAPEIIALVFGAEYLPGASSFQVLLLTLIITFPSAILNNAIFAYGKEKLLIWYVGIGAVSNVLLDIFLIPKFGIVGSAWTTLVAQSLSMAYLWFHLQHANPFAVLNHLKGIFKATAIMGVLVLVLSLLHVQILLTVAAAIIAYFGILYQRHEPLLKEIKQVLAPQQS